MIFVVLGEFSFRTNCFRLLNWPNIHAQTFFTPNEKYNNVHLQVQQLMFEISRLTNPGTGNQAVLSWWHLFNVWCTVPCNDWGNTCTSCHLEKDMYSSLESLIFADAIFSWFRGNLSSMKLQLRQFIVLRRIYCL